MDLKDRLSDDLSHECEHLAYEILCLWQDITANLLFEKPIMQQLVLIDERQKQINELRAAIERRIFNGN